MGLQFIFGRAGTGKSQYCFEQISKQVQNGQRVFMITPEQFSFTAEKKLMERLAKKAVVNAEVITFQRMAYRILSQVGGASKKMLTHCGKAMLTYDVLKKQKKNLTFLGKSEENIDLIQTTITEMKKHGVTLEYLKKQEQKLKNPYLQLKIKDVITIYEVLLEQMQDSYFDENDQLTLLEQQIEQVEDFKDSYIYIDEFAGFTYQEYQIITKLLKQAKKVSITITANSLEIDNSPDQDIFYDNKKTIETIKQIAIQNGIVIENPIKIVESKRFQNEELSHLEKNLYAIPYQKYEKPLSHIRLFLANNPYSEIEKIATQITKLVRQGYRYRDIAVITKQISQYSSLVKAIFKQYEIPVFIDEKKEVSQNIMIQFLLSLIEIFHKSWSYEAVFSYIKTGFLNLDSDEIFQLENYCIRWGIKGKKWYEKDWQYGMITQEDENKVKRYNKIRRQIVEPLIDLKQNLEKNKTGKDMTKVIYEFLIQQKIDQRLEEKIKKLEELGFLEMANEYKTSWTHTMETLDEIAYLFEKQTLSFKQYFNLLKVGFNHTSLGKIPGTLDQVILGDVDRSRSHKTKAIFIIGINDGVFPEEHKEEGFFNDRDRDILKEAGVELAKNTLEKLYENNFNIYKAFTTAEDKLYLSYVSSDREGKSLRPSILIARLKKMYPMLEEQSDMIQKEESILTKESTFEILLKKIVEVSEKKQVDPIWYEVYEFYTKDLFWKEKLESSRQGLLYTNLPQEIQKETIGKLYGDTLKTSISKLEQYRSCPFSFFLRYGLKLQENQTYQIQTIDTGSFMHDVIDTFFEQIKEKDIPVRKIEDAKVEEIIDEIIQEKLQMPRNYIFTSSAKFKVLTARLKRVVVKSMLYIIQGLKNTDFEVVGNELEFKKGKEYPPIILEIEDGKKVEITGKIDRVDLAKTAEGKYLRIIDYKSSVKNLDLNEVLAGIQLQLLTYLDATCKIEEVMPAGVLYFSLVDPMIKANHSMLEEEIEREIKKKFKMQGLLLADVKIIKMMDKTLEKGASDSIPVYLDKEGNLSKAKSSVVSKKQFEDLQKYMQKTIREIANEIMQGKIDLRPYYHIKNKKTPCQYCSYRSICNFQNGFCQNQYRYIGGQDKNKVLEEIRKEVEGYEN